MHPSGNVSTMEPTKIIKAEDLEKLSPAEQDALS
jgi:hypothetical protein